MYAIWKITAHPTVDFAAEELKKYLRMMMPRCGEIPIAYDRAATSGLRIGLMQDFALDVSDAQDPALDDIVYIETQETGGVIAGSNPGATLIAVYRYLRLCGCRWLFPGVDGEWIPMIEGLPQLSYRKMADYRYRGQCNEGAEYQQNMLETIDFSPKIGMNTYMIEFDNPYAYYKNYYNHTLSTCREPEPVDTDTVLQWKRQCEVEIQKRGLHLHDMGHGWTAEPFGISSLEGWTAAKPEDLPAESLQYLALTDGARQPFQGVPINTNICMSNPAARRIMANYIADYAQTQNNVDFLHIWLADNSNNHCECEACQQKDTSDWYVILLNEIDAELTARGLGTHLVFIVYVDTFWPPKQETIHNPARFTMLYAPITRLYTETYGEKADIAKVTPYQRNHNALPQGMAECLGYLDAWKKIWPGDCFCYEYHFWRHQYFDPSGLYLAKLLYDDIQALRKHGLNGIVEDGSQRSFFPTGFAYYVYGETLFDAQVSFEPLVEDYFSHAFGSAWREALKYLQSVCERLDYAYLYGLKSADPAKGAHYAPEYAQKAAEVLAITARFAPTAERETRQKYRAATVSWQLLRYFLEYAAGIAKMVIPLANGDGELAKKEKARLVDAFSRHEIYIERYYDHYLASRVLEEMVR